MMKRRNSLMIPPPPALPPAAAAGSDRADGSMPVLETFDLPQAMLAQFPQNSTSGWAMKLSTNGQVWLPVYGSLTSRALWIVTRYRAERDDNVLPISIVNSAVHGHDFQDQPFTLSISLDSIEYVRQRHTLRRTLYFRGTAPWLTQLYDASRASSRDKVKAAGSASEESEDEQSSRSSHHVPVYRCQCWPEVVERVKEVYQAKKDGRKPSSKKAIKCAGPHHPCFGRLPYIPLPYLSPVKFRMKHETPIPTVYIDKYGNFYTKADEDDRLAFQEEMVLPSDAINKQIFSRSKKAARDKAAGTDVPSRHDLPNQMQGLSIHRAETVSAHDSETGHRRPSNEKRRGSFSEASGDLALADTQDELHRLSVASLGADHPPPRSSRVRPSICPSHSNPVSL
jgi:hypothetical protein